MVKEMGHYIMDFRVSLKKVLICAEHVVLRKRMAVCGVFTAYSIDKKYRRNSGKLWQSLKLESGIAACL